jgi:transcriptional regulator with XRE-family HTH domain
VELTLRDLREAKGLTQEQIARTLKMSKSMYHSIEAGQRRPNIDSVHILALIYNTSMDYIYHAFYRRRVVWHFPDGELEYVRKQSMQFDITYLRKRIMPDSLPEPIQPAKPPHIPSALISTNFNTPD